MEVENDDTRAYLSWRGGGYHITLDKYFNNVR